MYHSDFFNLFDKYRSEYLKFERVPIKRSIFRDVHAFLLLEQLILSIPNHSQGEIISAAEHDEIWLNVNLEELAKIINEEQIIELIRCGVMIDNNNDSLHMFK